MNDISIELLSNIRYYLLFFTLQTPFKYNCSLLNNTIDNKFKHLPFIFL